MSMEEFDKRLLRELESLKLLAIDKLKYAVNWLVLVLRFIRDILTRYKIYLQRVQLLPQEVREQRRFTRDAYI